MWGILNKRAVKHVHGNAHTNTVFELARTSSGDRGGLPDRSTVADHTKNGSGVSLGGGHSMSAYGI